MLRCDYLLLLVFIDLRLPNGLVSASSRPGPEVFTSFCQVRRIAWKRKKLYNIKNNNNTTRVQEKKQTVFKASRNFSKRKGT
jgi:hypothetical protein